MWNSMFGTPPTTDESDGNASTGHASTEDRSVEVMLRNGSGNLSASRSSGVFGSLRNSSTLTSRLGSNLAGNTVVDDDEESAQRGADLTLLTSKKVSNTMSLDSLESILRQQESNISGAAVSFAPNGVLEDQLSRKLSVVSSGEYKGGSWVCRPYKIEILTQQLDGNSPGSGRRTAIIAALREMGVKVFVIDATNTTTTNDLLHHVRRVVSFVAMENTVIASNEPLGFQRCLLYQDKAGRLFNLTLSKHAAGPAARWQEYLDTFSGFQAMVGLLVLCRSFPCASEYGLEQNLKPAYISLILGLVLTEEISLSWLNASMMVHAMPSVSAMTLISPLGSDINRKVLVLCLAVAGFTTGKLQSLLTLLGISLACLVLLANLGSRAWHFLRWKPLQYHGLGASLVAYMYAVLTGAAVPYMGHRVVSIGGKGAMEYVILTSVKVAAAFIISDIDEVQKFLVVGSETCNQDYVNLSVGIWWFVTLVSCLVLVRVLPRRDQSPQDGEHLLIQDHASPVGYKVPSLPDFEVDPTLAYSGLPILNMTCEFGTGIVIAVIVGIGIVYLGFTDLDENFFETAQTLVDKIT